MQMPTPDHAQPMAVATLAATSVVGAVIEPSPAKVANTAPAPVVTPAPAATAAANPPVVGLPKVQSFTLPIESLLQVATSSGLSWVNSDAAKIAAVQAAIAAEPKPVHVPRERALRVELDNRPLILVETKRDLRNLTLPFESASSPQQ